MSAPSAGLFSRFCRALLRLAGWKVVLIWPPGPRAVIIFYPHTSNRDFVIGILARFAVGIPVRWVGIDTYLDLTGREEEDLARIRACYSDKRGRYPEKQGDIRFIA